MHTAEVTGTLLTVVRLLSMAEDLSDPLLSSTKAKVKKFKFPEEDKLKNAVPYVATKSVFISARKDSSRNEGLTINKDTIVLLNRDAHDSAYECYLPVPGYISSETKYESLIDLLSHELLIQNESTLYEKLCKDKNACIEWVKLQFLLHPLILNWIVLVILGVLEVFVITDIIFDTIVAIELYKNGERMWFTASCVLLVAPYLVH